MKPKVLIIALFSLWALACSSRAWAQTFGPPVPTERLLQFLDREGNVRFTLASYYAHMSEESDQDQQQESALTSQAHWGAQRFTEPVSASRVPWAWPRSCGSVR